MKTLLAILIIFLSSCESTYNSNYKKWESLSDSFNLYSDKWLCYRKCGKDDSTRWASGLTDSFFKLEKVAYKNLYPNGNPFDIVQEDDKCKCQ